MHLFNSREFEDYSHRTFLSVKKNLETSVQLEAQRVQDPIESETESLYNVHSPAGELALYYDGTTASLPKQILDVENIRELLNFAYQGFTKEQKEGLLNLLPYKDQGIIQDLLRGKEFKFCNPVDQFDKQLKSGYFTRIRQKEEQLNEALALRYLIQYSKDLLEQIRESREDFKGARTHYAPELSQLSSLEDLYPSQDFESASQQTQTQEMIEDENEEFQADLKEVFFRYQDRRKTQEELIAMNDDRGEYKASKVVKPMLVQTKIVRSQDWVEVFRKQEEQRYKNPTKPYTYICEDGTKATVAPVAKKMAAGVGKPREHVMLKNQRPSCVTILTLVRDAAARLPNGVGTRADICQLLKESQYVNQDIGDEKINTIVSGALDRLHYMADACVKYDSEKKLWQYLHLERTGSVRDDDPNEEYRERKTYKKKRADEGDDNE